MTRSGEYVTVLEKIGWASCSWSNGRSYANNINNATSNNREINNVKLYQLLYGRSKKRMKPIMVDSRHKCENYRDARQNVKGWHEIVEAPPGAEVWRQKTTSVEGGWIGKHGFSPHT